MPNRIIKESICASPEIEGLTWFEEVLFYRLIVSCDDYGRFDGRSILIKNKLFPLKENITVKSIDAAINKLLTVGLVVLYEFEGRPYLQLATWEKHQTVRAKKSKYPPFDRMLNADEINCMQMQADVCKCSRNPIQSESNPNTNTSTAKAARAPKRKFGEFGNVLLTDAEYEKLQKEYGNADELIAFLSEYIERKGYKAKSHYLTIKKWVIDAVKEQKNKRPENGFISSNADYDQIEQMLKGEKIWD